MAKRANQPQQSSDTPPAEGAAPTGTEQQQTPPSPAVDAAAATPTPAPDANAPDQTPPAKEPEGDSLPIASDDKAPVERFPEGEPRSNRDARKQQLRLVISNAEDIIIRRAAYLFGTRILADGSGTTEFITSKDVDLPEGLPATIVQNAAGRLSTAGAVINAGFTASKDGTSQVHLWRIANRPALERWLAENPVDSLEFDSDEVESAVEELAVLEGTKKAKA